VKFRFIRDHLVPEFTVFDCCRVLGVSHSGYYRWRKEPVGRREAAQAELVEEIKVVHLSSRRTYGSPRVHRELVKSGRKVSRNTVAKAMRSAGIRSKTARRFRVRTTDSNHPHRIAPNVLDRDFTADGVNKVWVCDITYIPTGEGFLYLAGILDVYSRMIVGWSMTDHMRAELVGAALEMARRSNKPRRDQPRELVLHSDRGVQYACDEHCAINEQHGMIQSMSRTGECLDNAMKESFWASLKKEVIHDADFATREEARRAIFDWIEIFYNRQRLHSSLGYVSPEAFEAAGRSS
jgi:transposase InsO family protein